MLDDFCEFYNYNPDAEIGDVGHKGGICTDWSRAIRLDFINQEYQHWEIMEAVRTFGHHSAAMIYPSNIEGGDLERANYEHGLVLDPWYTGKVQIYPGVAWENNSRVAISYDSCESLAKTIQSGYKGYKYRVRDIFMHELNKNRWRF